MKLGDMAVRWATAGGEFVAASTHRVGELSCHGDLFWITIVPNRINLGGSPPMHRMQ